MSEPVDGARAASATRLPHPALRTLVTTYHAYRYAGLEPGLHYGVPSTSLTVVLSFDRPIEVGALADAGRWRHWSMTSGLGMSPAGIYHDGTMHGIQLDLTPLGARALFGVPAAALHDELVGLGDVLGSRGPRLYDAVATPPGWPGRFAALDRELLAMANASDDRRGDDKTLRHAWQRLHATRGMLPVATLADEVGWSRRHLTQRFAGEYGIGPKQAARLVRFATARDLVVNRGAALADVAVRCGYADQAHLTREWRELAGVPPTAWLKQEHPFLQERVAVL
jgi:AraC-like DNA-binding protein